MKIKLKTITLKIKVIFKRFIFTVKDKFLLDKSIFLHDTIENKVLNSIRSLSKDTQQSDFEPSTSLDSNSCSSNSQPQSSRRSPSPSSPFSRYSPNMSRRSFGKLGRTLRFYFNFKK